MKVHLLIIFLSWVCFSAFGQDTLRLIDGTAPSVQVVGIEGGVISYRLEAQPDGPLRKIHRSELLEIVYKDGKRIIYPRPTNPISLRDSLVEPAESWTLRRTMINGLSLDSIDFEEYCIISLILTIDAEGQVVDAEINKPRSTTNNLMMIHQVIDEVKRQLRYSKNADAEPEKVLLDIGLQPN